MKLYIPINGNPMKAFLLMLGGLFTGYLIAFALIFFAAKLNAPFGEILFHQAPVTAEYVRWMFVLSTPLTFGFPVLWVARTYKPGQGLSFLQINKPTTGGIVLFALLAMVLGQGFISLLGEWNSHLVLPQSLAGLEQWMKSSEKQASDTMNLVMQTHSYGVLLLNILLMAFLPGIFEELLFRGVIQNLMIDSLRRVHIAVWITAFVFAFIHMEFYSFLPRLALGLLLGYLAVWSRSLWPSIIVHVVNNAMVVLMTFSAYNKVISPDIEKSMEHIDPVYGVVSLAAALWMLFLVKQLSDRKETTQ
ncbi:CPBP family intramembrane glutamic endopeptidase [Parabacteroides sp. FAFU027]|uniref:CPBP family intramembrane glutamic endopeptidase n=1 Tax=Parabacteroides sp. FAFU027 TaxID=2922715 RepID=UPI001FAFBD6B|nr:CPBP family intramembrane glutamic endopeptidase [Parabacteroides sp. FAFU027]